MTRYEATIRHHGSPLPVINENCVGFTKHVEPVLRANFLVDIGVVLLAELWDLTMSDSIENAKTLAQRVPCRNSTIQSQRVRMAHVTVKEDGESGGTDLDLTLCRILGNGECVVCVALLTKDVEKSLLSPLAGTVSHVDFVVFERAGKRRSVL